MKTSICCAALLLYVGLWDFPELKNDKTSQLVSCSPAGNFISSFFASCESSGRINTLLVSRVIDWVKERKSFHPQRSPRCENTFIVMSDCEIEYDKSLHHDVDFYSSFVTVINIQLVNWSGALCLFSCRLRRRLVESSASFITHSSFRWWWEINSKFIENILVDNLSQWFFFSPSLLLLTHKCAMNVDQCGDRKCDSLLQNSNQVNYDAGNIRFWFETKC